MKYTISVESDDAETIQTLAILADILTSGTPGASKKLNFRSETVPSALIQLGRALAGSTLHVRFGMEEMLDTGHVRGLWWEVFEAFALAGQGLEKPIIKRGSDD